MSEKNTDESRATGHAPKDFQPFHSAVNRIPLLRARAQAHAAEVQAHAKEAQAHTAEAQARAKEAQTHATDVRNAVGAFPKPLFDDGVARGHDRL